MNTKRLISLSAALAIAGFSMPISHTAQAQAASAALPVPAVATDESVEIRNRSVIPPVSAKVSDAQQEANKRVVLQWHYEFFDLGHFEEACNKYMAENFQQNDPREPSGRANYVKAFKGNAYVPKKAGERPPLLAVFAEGDLVMVVIPEDWKPGQDGNGKGTIHTNMYRLKDGKIVAMWVSGST